MTDTITLTGWLQDQQGLAVATFFLILVGFALWREWIVTAGRHREAVNDRDWWRDRATERERELEQNWAHQDRVIDAMETMADMLQALLDKRSVRWFQRWRP